MNNDIKKVFKFEVNKFKQNKILFRIFLTFLIVLPLFLIITYFFQEDNTTPNKSAFEREQIILNYQDELVTIQEKLDNHKYSVYELNGLINKKEKLEYLIATNTIDDDYLTNGDSKNFNYFGITLANFFFHLSYIVLILLAIFLPIYTFLIDVNNGTFKNILASPIKRKDLFKGKLLFQIVILFGVTLLFILIPTFFGLLSIDAKYLVATNNGYTALNCYSRLLGSFVGLFILLATILIIMDFVVILSKSILLSVTFPIVLIIICATIKSYIDHVGGISVDKSGYLIPFLNVFYAFDVYNINTLYIAICYLTFIILMYLLTKKIYKKIGY